MVDILLGNQSSPYIDVTCFCFFRLLFDELNMLATRRIRIRISMFGDYSVACFLLRLYFDCRLFDCACIISCTRQTYSFELHAGYLYTLASTQALKVRSRIPYSSIITLHNITIRFIIDKPRVIIQPRKVQLHQQLVNPRCFARNIHVSIFH